MLHNEKKILKHFLALKPRRTFDKQNIKSIMN